MRTPLLSRRVGEVCIHFTLFFAAHPTQEPFHRSSHAPTTYPCSLYPPITYIPLLYRPTYISLSTLVSHLNLIVSTQQAVGSETESTSSSKKIYSWHFLCMWMLIVLSLTPVTSFCTRILSKGSVWQGLLTVRLEQTLIEYWTVTAATRICKRIIL